MIFKQSLDKRLESWSNLRKGLDQSPDPLQDVWEYWKQAPFIPVNTKIDPYCQNKWPSPWEIIADNVYDNFTMALMIGWTLKLTNKFSNSNITIKIVVDNCKDLEYNLVYVDDSWVINYNDNGPVEIDNLPNSFLLQNQIEVFCPR